MRRFGASGTDGLIRKLNLIVIVFADTKKKNGSPINRIKVWERIDATKNGEWLESLIDFQTTLKNKKKRAVSFTVYIYLGIFLKSHNYRRA